MYASIKPLHKAILTLPDGKRVEVERIGRGRYTTAWANGTRVYLQTSEKDCSKEILENLRRKPHIPDCTRLGDFSGPYRLYAMPKYRKVTARETPTAWKQLKALVAMREEAWKLAGSRTANVWHPPTGYEINDAFREILDDTEAGCGTQEPGVLPEELYATLRLLLDEASNYGEYAVEFSRANVAADKKGRLILLDPLFDMYEARTSREAALKRRRGY